MPSASIQDLCRAREGTRPRSRVLVSGTKAKIMLPCGRVAVIDARFAAKARLFAWSYGGSRAGNHYVRSSNWLGGGKKKTFFLHHLILPLKRGVFTDHRDGDTLNNLSKNLRYATRPQNSINSRPRKQLPYSAPVGVTWDRKKGWRVRIMIDGKTRHVGWYKTKSSASKAAKLAHLEAHGAYSCYARGAR